MSDASVLDISARAQLALTSSEIFALRDLRVERRGNSLLLCGFVSTYYHKQLAQEIVRAVAKQLDVINSIEVR